jgi:hypothetical protein
MVENFIELRDVNILKNLVYCLCDKNLQILNN